jgi:hypothetical protein
LTWNQAFEKGRLNELADLFPERSRGISTILSNIRDLMSPFKAKSLYHWQFNGSYSIKAVLPALVPDLSYDSLEISNGEMASSAWMKMIQMDEAEERANLRQQLLQYCHLDTLAMIRILEKLKGMAISLT